MLTSSRAFLALLALLSQVAPGSATSVPIVSCTTNSDVQVFQNPSFESGALDNGWTISNVFWGTSSYGVVEVGTTAAQGSAEDGSYYFQTYGSNHMFDLSQTVSNLVVGTTYTVTYYSHVIQSPISLSSCWDYVYLDTTATQVGYFYYSPSTTWTVHSFTFQATATSHTLIFAPDCGSGSSSSWYMGWDNFQIVGETQVCSTTYSTIPTPTPTPTPSSSSAVQSSSSAVQSSSSAVQSSSSAVRSSSPTTPSSTAAVSSSAVIIPSSTTTASSSAAVRQSSTRVSPSSRPCRTRTKTSSTGAVSFSSAATSAVSSTTASTTTGNNGSGSSPSSAVSSGTTFTTTSQGGSGGAGSTTSTILSTRTATITACPSTVANCPASARTTFTTTEVVIVSTTVCPVTATGTSEPTGGSGAGGDSITETIYSTRVSTIYQCASTVTNCPYASRTANAVTETIVVGTTVYPASSAHTSNPGSSYSSNSGPGSGSGSTSVSTSGSSSSSGSGSSSSSYGSGSASNSTSGYGSASASGSGSRTLVSSSHTAASSTTSASQPAYTGASVSQSTFLPGALLASISGLLAAWHVLL